MTMKEACLEGTLRPDGTLVLDLPPDLPPGRVTIRMQSLASLPDGDPFFELLKGIWATRAQAGLCPRSVEEIELQRRRLRDESEQEVVDAGRIQQECRVSSNQVLNPFKGQ